MCAFSSPVTAAEPGRAFSALSTSGSAPQGQDAPGGPVFSAGPVGLAGSAAMGLSVGLLAAAAALFAVRENPELRDDFRPIAQPITGVLATASAMSLFVGGATMLALDLLWLSEPTEEGAPKPNPLEPHKT